AAVNYHVEDAAGDERAWAAALCQRHGLPFTAVSRAAPPLVGTDFAELARHVGPAMSALGTPRGRDARARGRGAGAGAVIRGAGGGGGFLPDADRTGHRGSLPRPRADGVAPSAGDRLAALAAAVGLVRAGRSLARGGAHAGRGLVGAAGTARPRRSRCGSTSL